MPKIINPNAILNGYIIELDGYFTIYFATLIFLLI